MKTIKLFMMLLASVLCLSSCSKDNDENDFNWPMEDIYGTWDITHIEAYGQWHEITDPAYASLRATATLYSNGKFKFTDSVGTGQGTYTASGNKIKAKAGNIYIEYTVVSLKDNRADVYIQNDGVSIHVKIKRR